MINHEIDGVVKYSVEHPPTKGEIFDGYAQLEALRARLYALGLVGEKDGIGYGNISMRDKSDGSFYITATQTGDKKSLSSSYYTHVLEYSFKSFSVSSEGEHPPSSEALSHAMIYELDPKISVVIHIHSMPLWQFMQESDELCTTAPYGTAQMAEEIETLYQNSDPLLQNYFVMRGHEEGIMLFGRDLAEAELALYRIISEWLDRSY